MQRFERAAFRLHSWYVFLGTPYTSCARLHNLHVLRMLVLLLVLQALWGPMSWKALPISSKNRNIRSIIHRQIYQCSTFLDPVSCNYVSGNLYVERALGLIPQELAWEILDRMTTGQIRAALVNPGQVKVSCFLKLCHTAQHRDGGCARANRRPRL